MSWEHFCHEADIGVHGVGSSKSQAFEEAAVALTAVITNPEWVASEQVVEVDCEASDDELLLADWLNAVVYEMATRRMLFRDFEVELDGRRLHGVLGGEAVDVRKHQPAVEVKGATFTELSLEQDVKGAWHARCVLDV